MIKGILRIHSYLANSVSALEYYQNLNLTLSREVCFKTDEATARAVSNAVVFIVENRATPGRGNGAERQSCCASKCNFAGITYSRRHCK